MDCQPGQKKVAVGEGSTVIISQRKTRSVRN